MKFFKTRVFVAVVFFVAGMTTMRIWDLRTFLRQPIMNHGPGWGYGTESESMEDVFNRMRRMQEEMIGRMQGGFGAPVEEESPGLSAERLMISEMREDENGYTFDVTVDGVPGVQFELQVDPGQLTLVAKTPDDGSAGYRAQLQRSFPIPEDVDAQGVQLENKEGKVVVRLPKRK